MLVDFSSSFVVWVACCFVFSLFPVSGPVGADYCTGSIDRRYVIRKNVLMRMDYRVGTWSILAGNILPGTCVAVIGVANGFGRDVVYGGA